MNFRTTTILLVLLVLVGTIVMFTRERAAHPLDQTIATDSTKLFDASPAKISGVSITATGEQTIALERDGVNWKLISPVHAPADNSLATQLVDDLLNLQSRGQLSEAQAKSAGTGLDSPRFVVGISTVNHTTFKLNVGERTASGDNLYVQRDGNSSVQIVPAEIVDALNRPASAFRRKQLFDISAAQIQQVKIVSGSSTISLRRDSTSNWSITEPVAHKGDAREIEDLLIALTGVSASDFVAEKVDDAKRRRLDSPQLEVQFSTAAPATMPTTAQANSNWHTLKLGGFVDVNKNNLYASSSDSPALFTVSASALSSLRKTPLDLRDREVLSIDPKDVQRVSISTETDAKTQAAAGRATSKNVAIERAPVPSTQPATMQSSTTQSIATQPLAKWIIPSTQTSAPSSNANDRSVDSFLQMLAPLRAEKFLDAPPSTSPSTSPGPLPSTRITLTIELRAGAKPIILHFVLGEMPRCEYNGVAFEPSRALLDVLERENFSTAQEPNDEPPQPR